MYGGQIVLAYTPESNQHKDCGWYGCKVSNYNGQGHGTIKFDHGNDRPTAFYVRQKVGSGLEGCVAYGDQIVLAYGPSSGDTSNCGWYGCRVGQYVEEQRKIIFTHGGDSPSAFYVRPKPRDGLPLMYGDQMVVALTAESGWTANCGWYGCSVGNYDDEKREIRFRNGGNFPTAYWVRPKVGSGSKGCVMYGGQIVLAYTPESNQHKDCGWYGCKVSNYNGQGHGTIKFDHGNDRPTAFYVRPKVGSGLEGCVQYGDQIVLAYGPSSGDTSNCGWYGCRVGNYKEEERTIIFGHGKNAPSAYYVRPPQTPKTDCGGSEGHEFGSVTCDGICVAPLFDAIEAFPFVGDMVKKARNGMCEGASVSGVLANGDCAVGGHHKHFKTGGAICDMLSSAFQIDSSGCDLIQNCIVKVITAGGNLRQCMENIKDVVVSGMKSVTNKLDSMSQQPGLPTLKCPLTVIPETVEDISEMVKKFIKAIDAVENLVNVLKDAKNPIIEIAKLVLDGKCEGMQWSFLVGLGVDFQFKATTLNDEVGVYLTMATPDIKALASKAVFTGRGHLIAGSSQPAIGMVAMLLRDLFNPQSETNIGLYYARSVSMSTSIGMEVSMGKSISFLAGDKNNWGGYGFEVGLSFDFPGVGPGLDVAAVFSAREDNQIKRLIGITVGQGLGASAESSAATLGLSGYVGCGLAATMALNADGEGDDVWDGWSNIGSTIRGNGANMCSLSKTQFQQSFHDISSMLSFRSNERNEAEKCAAAAKCIAEECSDNELELCYECKIERKKACNKCDIKVRGDCSKCRAGDCHVRSCRRWDFVCEAKRAKDLLKCAGDLAPNIVKCTGNIICEAWHYYTIPGQARDCLTESAVCTAWDWKEEVATGAATCGEILQCLNPLNCAAMFLDCNVKNWAPRCAEGVKRCIGEHSD